MSRRKAKPAVALAAAGGKSALVEPHGQPISRAASPIPPGRRRFYRLTLACGMPLLLLLLLEGFLRISGLGLPLGFFVRNDPDTYTANRYFGWQFFPPETATYPHPFRMAARKAQDTRRVFILGESAALGTPAPPFGFGRILEHMLQRQFPTQRWEVINVAMRGIDSHVVRRIARECAGHEPDLFIVYMGNNEAVGLHSPSAQTRASPPLWCLRAMDGIRSTQVGQLVLKVGRKFQKAEPASQDMEFFRAQRLAAADPRRRSIYRNFEQNLAEICRIGTGAGARLVVCTLGANLKDFPPLGSLPRAGLTEAERQQWQAAWQAGVTAEAAGKHREAIESYQSAMRIDNQYAELHYRRARCHLGAGEVAQARDHFGSARDWDALQFRADSHLNQVVRQVVKSLNNPGVTLFDAEAMLAQNTEHGIPGEHWFNDHVHFSFDGDYAMAKALFAHAVSALKVAPGSADVPGPLPTRAECAAALAFTRWEEVSVKAGVVASLNRPPFLDQLDQKARQASAEAAVKQQLATFTPEELRSLAGVCRAAIARNPGDWQLHFVCGNYLLHGLKDPGAAAEEYRAVVRLLPRISPFRHALATALANAGKRYEAMNELDAILQVDRRYAPARETLAQLGKR